jgi:hypothetical protein
MFQEMLSFFRELQRHIGLHIGSTAECLLAGCQNLLSHEGETPLSCIANRRSGRKKI